MWQLRLRRAMHGRRVTGTILEQCWREPLPSTGTDWRRVSFLVVDAEMSSLDVESGELLSMGWVSVQDGAIALASAGHALVKAENSVGQSATIHSIRDCELSTAEPLKEALAQLLDAALGKVLVFHNAALDLAYLNRACLQAYGAPLLFPVVDTMQQERALLQRRGLPIKAGDLRLHACRDRYHLPVHRAHNALLDALATAELLLAMAVQRGNGQPFALDRLL